MKHLHRTLRCLTTLLVLATALHGRGQGGDKALQVEADALFEQGAYAKAYPLYSQLVSLAPQDHDLNFKLGACTIYGEEDRAKAIGYLRFALSGPATSGAAWFFLGKAYQLDYRFNEALNAYNQFRGTGDKKLLARFPVDALEQQCRNGTHLLNNLKDIQVLNKVAVETSDFFRFYDLGDIGGKIVVTPDELLSNVDRRSGERFLVYLPDKQGPIYFSSYGKDGKNGRDIYRTELLPTGGYAAPVSLAGYINTPEDEDFAVMAADGRTFFFCSKGHNSMGGYDVFKSAYDKGMDVFSAPENMDFAVNTPADELLYIVGPDGKEACFASDRNSKQSMVHVYRVSTTQTPINITLLKGTFASSLDSADKRAKITVVDEITGERITEVNTDAQGNYTLVLPRGGKYRVMVETGPEQRTYLTSLAVPPSSKPQAFVQEMGLVNRAGVVVELTTHFDQPMNEDILALALEEVRRRARLEVTAPRVPTTVVAPLASAGDPLQEAGFDGTVTMAQALDMAARETRSEQERGAEQERISKAALDLSVANLAISEEQAAVAADLLLRANTLPEGADRDHHFRKAAQARMNSEDARQRSMAAFRAGSTLAAERTSTRKLEVDARSLQLTLERAAKANDLAATTAALKQLKQAVDARKGPDVRPDDTEAMRRQAKQAETEAQAKLRRATSQREEQGLLSERVARLSTETQQAKGRKQQELRQQLTDLQGQESAMIEEVEKAFQVARETEEAAALTRGQVQLLRHLGAAKEQGRSDQAAMVPEDLEQRLEAVRERNAGLRIDEQFLPVVAMSPTERDLRIFNWGVPANLAGAASSATLAATSPAEAALGQDAQAQQAAVATAFDQQRAPTVPMDQAAGVTSTASADRRTPQESTVLTDSGRVVQADPESAQDRPQQRNADGQGEPIVESQAPQPPGSITDGKEVQTTDPVPMPGTNVAHRGSGKEQVQDVVRTTPDAGTGRQPEVALPARDTMVERHAVAIVQLPGVNEPGSVANPEPVPARINEQTMARKGEADSIRTDGSAVAQVPLDAGKVGADEAQGMETDEQLFLLQNALAELEQLRKAEKDPGRKDSLDLLVVAQKSRIAMTTGGQRGAPPQSAQLDGHNYVLLNFDLAIMDEELLQEIFPDFRLYRDSINNGPGTTVEKAARTHALELQLVERIDVQMQALVAHLEKHPDRADELLPGLERLRRTKVAHIELAEQALAMSQRTYVAAETKAMEDEILAGMGDAPPEAGAPAELEPVTPHNDAYVQVEPDINRIYGSPLVPRATKVEGAVARLEQDLALAEDLQMEVDSLQRAMAGLDEGGELDMLQERTDRKMDDLLIHLVDLGQRSVFITKSEYDLAKDSAKVLGKKVQALGLAPDLPMEQMARALEVEARNAMGQAKVLRKKADNANDIMQRDSLYRSAYAEELQALRKMDRSLTVRNFILNDHVAATGPLTYAEVEQRMFADGSHEPRARTMDLSVTTAPEREATTAQVRSAPLDSGMTRTLQDGPVALGMERPEGRKQQLVALGKTVADSTALSGYLQRYYYLDARERIQVLGGTEESRYFLMKGHAMEQRAAAVNTLAEAHGARELAANLKEESADRGEDPTAQEQTGKLARRAQALLLRADSLQQAALRQEASADLIDAQAAAWMQGLQAERSAAIMDLEQSNRRTEPVLARNRPMAGGTVTEQDAAANSRAVQPHTTAELPVPVPPVLATDASKPPDLANVAGTPAMPRTSEQPVHLATARATVAPAPLNITGPLAQNVFDLAGNTPSRKGPIPLDPVMPEGVVYKVQVGAFRNPLPPEAFSDMSPLTGERATNGVIRYSAGLFTDAASAAEAGTKLRQRGYRDAFVVAYMDGKRVSLRAAALAERPALAGPAPIAGAGVPEGILPVQPAEPVTAAPANLTGAGAVAAAESAVLASYPATAQAVLEEFKPGQDAAAYYNDPAAAPAKQVETVKGLFFTVQVGVYSKPTPLDRLFNITPLNSELTANAKIRYTTGLFLDEEQAAERKAGAVQLGVVDAFVTAYLNGKRIPLRDARVLLGRFGRAILADSAEQGR